MKTIERERHNWIIIPIILVIGFLCVVVAGQLALRFSPSWELNANMNSLLDPNSDFLTHKPDGFIEPLDPLILTPPVWNALSLNSGASQITRTPFPTTAATLPAVPTTISYATNTAAVMISPTNTFVSGPWVPSSTSKPKQPTNTISNVPTATATSKPTNTPLPAADLQITKSDGVSSYTAGGALTYTVTATNNSAVPVTGVLIIDNIPSQIASWTWVCTSQNGGASGCDGAVNSNMNFSDSVDLPGGASIVYTVNGTVSTSASGDLSNTATINLPGDTDPVPANNSATDTDTEVIIADLSITKTNGVTVYTAGGTLEYTITVTNNGPSAVVGALVTDNLPTQITGWDWVCTSQLNGASGCDGMNSNLNFSDTVNLPAGATIVYNVTATISPAASGDLTNTATISVPPGSTDPAPGNNTATHTDQILVSDPFPWGDIGTAKDNSTETLPSGSSLTLALSSPLIVGGHPGDDLVYYELAAGSGILMDHVTLQLFDGYNWYTILNWGDNIADANTNININSIGGTEDDNRDLSSALLYNSTGVAIDLDGLIPNGTYSYIRISAPAGDPGSDGCDVDAIVILP